MYNPFVWLSGADASLIEKCPNHKRYEKIKFSGIGALVLIPAIIGFFSMSYAISTIVNEAWMYYGGGVLWGLIVLAIDRVLVSTTIKSEVNPYGMLSIIARYALALFLGVAVGHPFALRWFDESIVQKLEKKQDVEITQRRELGENKKKALVTGPVAQQIAAKTSLMECKRALLTDEQSGIDSKRECGSTSERSGKECGPRCMNIQKQITEIQSEIKALETKAKESGESGERTASASKIDEDTKRDIERIEQRFSTDYLARVDALAELQNGNPNLEKREPPKPHVWWASWFIILFFMILDIVPITLKIAIPMGEYEIIRDRQLDETKLKQSAEKTAFQIHTNTVYQRTFLEKLDNSAVMENISHVTELTHQFIRQQEKERLEFNRKLKDIQSNVLSIRDQEQQAKYEEYILQIKQTFNSALKRAQTNFQEYIQGWK